ncbi:GNA1162 family protein [Methylicorpusculum sp.]|uniref:DUF799 domain-containing protein n=1 Tax=Methylicorpusculum sp. TaxID=2713644 RepID=UPI002722551B|nr:GNA1162 family protein [Methylicorpusculum sp.]MDO8845747.1 DUF799 family lipoprotein [Methylicorpusculum sp.]
MTPASLIFRFLSVLLLVFLTGCPSKLPFDYSAFRNYRPRSILVLPPLNLTTDVNAPYSYLSTITHPLAECGYYVFPVAVIDAYMKENGLPSSEEMHGVPLKKIKEIIGADAVLYVTIEEWGQKYMVLQSITTIKASAKLLDTASGEVIWYGTQSIVQGSGGGDPVVMLINAAVVQIINSMTDYTHDLSRVANQDMINNPDEGFLAGPYLAPRESEHCGNH